MIFQKEYIVFGSEERQQQHTQRHGAKSDMYLKDRWKDQLHKSSRQQKTQAGKNTGRSLKKKGIKMRGTEVNIKVNNT